MATGDAFSDWDKIEPTKVKQLQPGRTVESIPKGIIALVEEAYNDNSPYSITLPTGVAAETFVTEAREYCRIRPGGALVFRHKRTEDGLTVNYSARVNNAPVTAATA